MPPPHTHIHNVPESLAKWSWCITEKRREEKRREEKRREEKRREEKRREEKRREEKRREEKRREEKEKRREDLHTLCYCMYFSHCTCMYESLPICSHCHTIALTCHLPIKHQRWPAIDLSGYYLYHFSINSNWNLAAFYSSQPRLLFLKYSGCPGSLWLEQGLFMARVTGFMTPSLVTVLLLHRLYRGFRSPRLDWVSSRSFFTGF